MAQLRFNRDRRGYETTALVHAGGRRRKGQRLLYFFRTPPAVRVGRAPIDEEAIRLLEQHNPDVHFDWTRILKDPPPAEPASRRDMREPREGRDRRRDTRPPRPRGSDMPYATPRGSGAPSDPGRDAEASEPSDAEFTSAPADLAMAYASSDLEFAAASPDPDLDEPGFAPPEATALAEDDALPGEPELSGASAAQARLGTEALGRLRARYAEVMARIAEQPLEEPAREELKARAERLNPDGWVTADEVTAALEQYETVFEELRALVGRHHRGRRGPRS